MRNVLTENKHTQEKKYNFRSNSPRAGFNVPEYHPSEGETW